MRQILSYAWPNQRTIVLRLGRLNLGVPRILQYIEDEVRYSIKHNRYLSVKQLFRPSQGNNYVNINVKTKLWTLCTIPFYRHTSLMLPKKSSSLTLFSAPHSPVIANKKHYTSLTIIHFLVFNILVFFNFWNDFEIIFEYIVIITWIQTRSSIFP